MVSLPPVRLKVAPLFTVTALSSPIELPPETAIVPAETVTAPLWVLVPVKVKVPAPALVKASVPDNTPDNVTESLASILPPPLPMVTAFERVVASAMIKLPPLRVICPEPILLTSVIENLPVWLAAVLIPPVQLLAAPDNLTVPFHALVSV